MRPEEKIALFFKDPNSELGTQATEQGTLYLLRREIKNIPIRPGETNWLVAIGILAGIDLLSKFYTGSDEIKKARPRFQGFIEHYITPNSRYTNSGEILWGLRNALMHSFGLLNRSRKTIGNKKIEVIERFTVKYEEAENDLLIYEYPRSSATRSEMHYQVNIKVLLNCFEKSIAQYQQELGLDTCFGNPGTSEMQLVYEMGLTADVRPILCLQENTVTGAADGYGRMAGKPAFTLMHVGAGFANGIANLQNAGRANTPIVNIIGANATYHQANYPEHEVIS